MKQVLLKRASEWYNRFVDYRIMMNGEELVRLRDGEEKRIAVPVPAVLEAKASGVGSNRLELQNIDSPDTEVVVRANRLTQVWTTLLAPAVPVAIGFVNFYGPLGSVKNVAIAVLAALMLVTIGLLTIWRNRWLVLELVNRNG